MQHIVTSTEARSAKELELGINLIYLFTQKWFTLHNSLHEIYQKRLYYYLYKPLGMFKLYNMAKRINKLPKYTMMRLY